MGNPGSAELDALFRDPGFSQDPYPTYDRLRETSPVFWSDANGGWMLFRWEDVHASLLDHQRFSSTGRFSAALQRLSPELREACGLLDAHFSVGMLASDPPHHTRMRALVTKAFTPRVIETLRPRIEALVSDLLDDIDPASPFDLIESLAYPLPATVISFLFGAPAADRERFKGWTKGILGFQGTGNPSRASIEAATEALADMRGYLDVLITARRRDPQDDLLSLLVAAEEEGDRLSTAELQTICVTLLTAGHETTTTLISNGVWLLLTHPEQHALLREQPDLMPNAIEEMLRYESPLQRNPRMVKSAFTYHGHDLRAGDYVMQVLGSANRDPAQFPAPARFDITRTPNRHLAFGHGVHFCLGAPLARLEAPIALRQLFARFPDLRMADDGVTWQRSGLLRGLTALPVRA